MGNVLVRLKVIEKESLARTPRVIDVTHDDVRRVDAVSGPLITSKLREMLEATTSDGRTVATLVAEVILSKALGGDFRFMTELLNRTEGKSPDRAKEPSTPTVLHWEEEGAIALIYGGKTAHPDSNATDPPEG